MRSVWHFLQHSGYLQSLHSAFAPTWTTHSMAQCHNCQLVPSDTVHALSVLPLASPSPHSPSSPFPSPHSLIPLSSPPLPLSSLPLPSPLSSPAASPQAEGGCWLPLPPKLVPQDWFNVHCSRDHAPHRPAAVPHSTGRRKGGWGGSDLGEDGARVNG